MRRSHYLFIGGVILAFLTGGGAFLLTNRSSSGSTLGQSVNAAIDELLTTGDRLLKLPMLVLLVIAAILAVALALPILRWGTRTGRLTWPRVSVAVIVGGALACLALAADYKIESLQDEVTQLRNQVRVTRFETPDDPVPTATAPTTAPNIARTTQSTTVVKATATAAAPRREYMIDVKNVTQELVALFGSVGVHPMIHDQATDFVEVDIRNPPIIAYMAVVNLKTPGLEVKFGGSLTQKTLTSTFARENKCQIAINGEAGNSPQANSGLGVWSGNMISEGKVILKETPTNKRPFLSFDKQNNATFTAMAATDRTIAPDKYNVIWGRLDAIIDGVVKTENERDRQPRTAMGLSKDGSKLYLMVVDGRQRQYSVGFTREQVGLFLKVFGAYNGMLCDEGGSSCVYLKKFNAIVNSPSDGEERPTYTHFGISLQ